jgi:hypothetical protein
MTARRTHNGLRASQLDWRGERSANQIPPASPEPARGTAAAINWHARFRLTNAQESRNPRASDQNHCKVVNDDFGHPAGDAVLAATGARLTAWAGPRAAVGRLGGDEPLTELTRSFSQVRRPFC